MTERWQERRIEDNLLKRELLLRLRAGHSGIPGQGRPATNEFRSKVRRMLLRHPVFAFKLYLRVIDTGLGRIDISERAPLSGSGTRGGAGPVRLVDTNTPASAAPGGAVARVPRAMNPLRASAITLGARPRRAHRPGRPLPVVAKRRRLRTVLQARFVRFQRVLRAASSGVVVTVARQRRLTHARLVRLQRTCASGLIRLQAEVRRLWLVSRARLVGVRRIGGPARAIRGSRMGRLRLVLNACVARLGLHARAAAEGLLASLRKTELSLRGLRRPRIPSTPTRALVRGSRPRVVGVLAGLALAAASTAAVIATHNLGSSDETGATVNGTLQSDQIVHRFFVLPPAPRSPKPAEQAAARATYRSKPRIAKRMTLVSNTVQAVTVPTLQQTSTTAAPSHNTGPAPLPAPAGSSGPTPLKAP